MEEAGTIAFMLFPKAIKRKIKGLNQKLNLEHVGNSFKVRSLRYQYPSTYIYLRAYT